MNRLLYKLPILLLLVALLLPASKTYAVSADHYAQSSRLASGRWAKIKVSSTGMHLITDAQLRNLGFTNPSAVNVYGLGGRELDYGLSRNTPDDLPLIPSVRTSKGIVFFAVNNITWGETSSYIRPYNHSINQYTNEPCYFISDIAVEGKEIQPSLTALKERPTNAATTFMERALHELELEPADELGSQVWGEDFRSKKIQSFSFTLPDMADDAAKAVIRFASKVSMGSSASISVTANGEALPSSSTDRMPGCESDTYGTVATTYKDITGLEGKLDLGIDFTYSGVLYKARLDYIQVFYNRELKLKNGELHFYVNLYNSGMDGVSVAGCSGNTEIWDVTDPVRPTRVNFTLDGDNVSFKINSNTGYREYVAFEPDAITRGVSPAGLVDNQDLHALPTPDMLIISPKEYLEGANSIAELHRSHDGMLVHVLTPDVVYNEFSGGNPDMGAFRRLMKMWYDRGNADGHEIKYCLIMGKALNDNRLIGSVAKNAGFKPMLMWQSYDGLNEHDSFSTDAWLGMLSDVEASNFSMRNGKMQVSVGRLPVTSASESLQMAAKIKKYVTEPDFGAWRNKVMLIADDDDNGVHFDQTDSIYNAMRRRGNGRHHVYDRLVLDTYERTSSGVGISYPEATSRMLANYNDGVLLTSYVGHANPTSWGHEHLWDWNDIKTLANKKLTFMFAFTCQFAYWDTMTTSAGETLMLMPDSGVIGMIVSTRTVYIPNNGNLSYAMMGHTFDRAADGGPLRWGDIYIRGMNGVVDENRLRYAFVGDPAVRMPGGSGEVRFTLIDGVDITSEPENLPEIAAKSKATVEGEILDADGNVDTGFNGRITLQLFDSERVITTKGNGSNGVVRVYNDRDKMLSTTTAVVSEGRWTATLHVPPEITGLYTTAMIAGYAWSDAGKESCGITEQLYVYGYDETSTDTRGPQFEAFYVNSPNLPADAVVSGNMIVFAKMRDESGINVSDSGLGHSLTLAIDGRDYRTDLKKYLTSDINDQELMVLSYPIEGMATGRHTLRLTVWDNANNFSESEIEINVGAAVDPNIIDIAAIHGTAGIDFRITLDRPNTPLTCKLGVYDLMGKKLWESNGQRNTDMDSVITDTWDLCDSGGHRVPRGIYIYRVEVEAADGLHSSKSKKISISAL